MPKVSVVCPTIRKEGLDVVRKALKKQTFKDFEWLIGSRFNPEIPEATWIPDNFEQGYWSLNRIYNSLFQHSSGDIIVTWQDWIYANPDALEKFVENVGKTNAVVSGVGDQYERVNKWGKPEVKIWSDPRKTTDYGSFYECNWNDAEWNFCAFPKEAIFSVGGMDEELDFLGYGGDQLQVSERMEQLGTLFFLDQTNLSYTVRHDRSNFEGQENWDKNHVLFARGKSGDTLYDERKRELVISGRWPVLPYLSRGDDYDQQDVPIES